MLGTLTVGQAPRADITPLLDAVLPPSTPRLHAGVLDGLSAQTIARNFAPKPGGALLTTRLLDGSAAAAADIARRGARALLLDCMGFVEHHRAAAARASRSPVILSNGLVAKLVSEIL